jgi:hypothetical protein
MASSRALRARRSGWLVPVVAALVVLAGCSAGEPAAPVAGGASPPPPPAEPTREMAAICGNQAPGPAEAPAGAVVVDAAVVGDLVAKTKANPPGSTFWLTSGVHTLGTHEYDQVAAKDGNTYIGGPGAIVDGRSVNQYAFTTTASDVTIRHLTIRGFAPPADQGVVNHDSGNGWIVEHNTIEENRGAALMAGDGQQVRFNCLRNNGQYGINAYQPGNGITGLVVERNEIVGNNTDDWETRNPGCGCTGGAKFWAVDRADIRWNWVHDNRGPGLWADTNNNDFLIEGNLIEDNDGEALFYETSYNLVMRGNVLNRNAIVAGKPFADRGDDFPIGAVYLSESGGEPRVPARTDLIEITGNVFEDNWSGITAWENADRFCGSAANTSTGSCTRLVESVADCAQPGIASEPLYSDCRWKTQRVDIHDNTFSFTPSAVGCSPFAGRMAVLSNYGTFPDWSPYQGEVIQQAIALDQDVRWRDNRYSGPWTFMLSEFGRSFGVAEWQGDPYRQDAGSTFESGGPDQACRGQG